MDPHSDDFHDSEIGDIYDLYNACNGVFFEGLLDKRKLDDYGPDEYEVLNISRLREVWDHTASGCATCNNIIKALDRMRGAINTEVSMI